MRLPSLFYREFFFVKNINYIYTSFENQLIMKTHWKVTAIFFIVLNIFPANAQIDENDITGNRKRFLKESAESACKCIDSIDTAYKSKKIVAKDISKCIDKQVIMYQLLDKTAVVANDKLKAFMKSDSTAINKSNIIVLSEKGSKDYNKYYYKLEQYLMDSCSSLKRKINDDEKFIELGASQNEKAKAFYAKGQDADAAGNFKKAIKFYKKALKIDPNFAFALDNLGLAYRKTKQYDKALESYAKSMKIIPTNKTPIMNSAVVYVYKKKWDKAIAMYKKLIDIDPDDPESFYGIGHVQMLSGDYENSLDNMCKAYNLYIEMNSPYRTDAEKMINTLYHYLKKEGKEEKFNEILKKNHIKTN